MKEIKTPSWEAFEVTITTLFENVREKKKTTKLYVSEPLSRGQGNARWKLETTLERYTSDPFEESAYYKAMLRVVNPVESFTEKAWNLSHEYQDSKDGPHAPLGYEFMIYLRHHGFPSPLLDWTRSPYVAAYFAFRHKPADNSDNVAVYSYLEYVGEAKGWCSSDPTVFALGSYVTTHRRHHTQQCEYTICKKQSSETSLYCNHEEAFAKDDRGQDILTKYVIPRSERRKFLERLDLMNVNAYSLFGSEESLMETLAYRAIEKKMNL